MAEPYVLALAAAAAVAVLQGVLARWRDLAPLTVSAGGIALLLADGPLPSTPPGEWREPELWAGLAVVATLSAAGQWRAARRGTARPELVALALVAVVALAAVSAALPGRPGLREGLAGGVALAGLVLAGFSVARLGARGVPVRWIGEIPVHGPPANAPPVPGEAGR